MATSNGNAGLQKGVCRNVNSADYSLLAGNLMYLSLLGELRHEEVFPIYGKGEAQFLPYMGKSARQGLAALTLYG